MCVVSAVERRLNTIYLVAYQLHEAGNVFCQSNVSRQKKRIYLNVYKWVLGMLLALNTAKLLLCANILLEAIFASK